MWGEAIRWCTCVCMTMHVPVRALSSRTRIPSWYYWNNLICSPILVTALQPMPPPPSHDDSACARRQGNVCYRSNWQADRMFYHDDGKGDYASVATSTIKMELAPLPACLPASHQYESMGKHRTRLWDATALPASSSWLWNIRNR